MKRRNALSLSLLILFLVTWTLFHVVNTPDYPHMYIQQLSTLDDSSGSITLDHVDKKLPFIFVFSQKYDETLMVLLLLLGHCSALILLHWRRLILGPVFYQSNNVIHLF